MSMTQPLANVEEQSVSGDIRTLDGQVINVRVEVPSDGSLWDEELIDAALMMIQQSYSGEVSLSRRVSHDVRSAAFDQAGVALSRRELIDHGAERDRFWLQAQRSRLNLRQGHQIIEQRVQLIGLLINRVEKAGDAIIGQTLAVVDQCGGSAASKAGSNAEWDSGDDPVMSSPGFSAGAQRREESRLASVLAGNNLSQIGPVVCRNYVAILRITASAACLLSSGDHVATAN
jgi:hypothetical protein